SLPSRQQGSERGLSCLRRLARSAQRFRLAQFSGLFLVPLRSSLLLSRSSSSTVRQGSRAAAVERVLPGRPVLFRQSFAPLVGWPLIALDKNLSIRRHAWLCKAESGFELQLHAYHLLHAVVPKICVLRCEGGLRIDTRYEGVDRLVRIRVQVDPPLLADLYFSNLTLGNK